MNRDQKKRLTELFTAHAADSLTPEEHEELQAHLRNDAEARRWWFVHQDVEIGLRAQVVAGRFTAPKAPKTRAIFPWLSWRPLTAAAAGLVFGLFSAAMAFALAVPRMKLDHQRVVPLFQESFEEVNAPPGRGFPREAGVWSGDFSAVVSAEEGRSPKEGLLMARLAPVEGRKFCVAARIVDLAELPPGSATETRTVEVSASFHGMDSEGGNQNQIRLAAFAEAPQEVKAIWNQDARLEQALLHLGRTVKTKPGEDGWQTLKASMEIPAGTRSLVIYLGAAVANEAEPKTPHYLDDIHAQILITETTP